MVKEDIYRNEVPASVDASKEQQCHVPSSDDVVKKEDIPRNEASVDASKEQQGQLLLYAYTVLSPNVQTNRNIYIFFFAKVIF